MTTATADQIGIGIHPGLTYEQYDAIDAWRRSTLMVGNDLSLAHMKAEKDNPKGESSEALDFGKALHSAILEPDDFNRRVVLGAINPKTGEPFGIDTKAQQEFIKDNPGMIVVARCYKEKLQGMAKAIRGDKYADSLFRATDATELTVVWEDSETGEPCKIRIDMRVSSLEVLGDLKSTECAKPENFAYSAEKYGYLAQAAMCIDGWHAVTGQWWEFVFVAVEKDPYHGVSCASIARGSPGYEIGRKQYRGPLEAASLARRSGVWESYPAGINPMQFADHVLRRHGIV